MSPHCKLFFIASCCREKEAVACLAITAAKHLASATLSHVAGADIFVQPDCVTPHPFLGVAQVLLSLNRHSMLPSALQLGAGELLGSIACGQMVSCIKVAPPGSFPFLRRWKFCSRSACSAL